MAGTWPNMDLSDLAARSRTHLNEAAAGFFSDAEIYRWLSAGTAEIADKAVCVRRILDAVTQSGVNTISAPGSRVHHIEHVPAGGRPWFLREIDPLKAGNNPLKGSAPQMWYPDGGLVYIEPTPDAVYPLRLYVSDVPKLVVASISGFSTGWAAGTGWTAGATAVHSGEPSGDLVYTAAGLDAGTDYTIGLTVIGVSGGTLTPYAGTTAGVPIATNGRHTQNLVSSSGTPALKFSATGTITIDDVTILKAADFSSATDQTELAPMWQHLAVLLAVRDGLKKDGRSAHQLLDALAESEIRHLRSQIVEIVPAGRSDRRAA